jgi:DinB superfamily
MNPDRQFWNKQQQSLRLYLAKKEFHSKAEALFLSQHAMVYSALMSNSGLWSFEDEVLEGVNSQQMRMIPRNCEHSIAWMMWHMTRCEDITMNLLVAGSPQVLLRENWFRHLKISLRDTGNAMDAADIIEFSLAIDLEALRAYRLAVGRRTREIVIQLQPDRVEQRVDPAGLEKIQADGAVLKAASGILDYWGGLTIAGLLLMPPTRHNFIHWNEALIVNKKFK